MVDIAFQITVGERERVTVLQLETHANKLKGQICA